MSVNVPAGATTLSNSQLQALWISNGGDPSLAPTMAAIALAESSGYPSADNSSDPYGGSFGLWQINGAHLGEAGVPTDYPQLYDPNANAAAAVAVYKQQGLAAWSTYRDGTYKNFLSGVSGLASGAEANLGDYLSAIVGQTILNVPAATTLANTATTGNPAGITDPVSSAVATVQSWGIGIAVFVIGAILIIGGLFMAAGGPTIVANAADTVKKNPEILA